MDMQVNHTAGRYLFIEGTKIVGRLQFQQGPVPEGRNGVTLEEVLGICRERLEHFQKGTLSCQENTDAITAIGTALHELEKRRQLRIDQDVEGTTRPHNSDSGW